MTFVSLPRRLDKFLKDELGWTRPVTHERLHEVQVNGESIRPCDIVLPEDAVSVGERIVEIGARRHRTFMFHKPAGIITAHSDPHQRPCLDMYSENWGLACAVGRLDKDTTGLLLITDDGDLTFSLMYPEFKVRKRYLIGLGREVEAGDPRIELLLQGIEIGDGPAAACSVDVRSPVELVMEIDEGRNRQIRRMCKVTRLPLESLHREALGSLELDVDLGEWRELGPAEVDQLWADVGGRDAVQERQKEALQRRVKVWREQGRPDTRLEEWLEERL